MAGESQFEGLGEGSPDESGRWVVSLPDGGAVRLETVPGGVLASIRICPIDAVENLGSLLADVIGRNFMWNAGPFAYAVDPDTEDLILQERLPKGSLETEADLDEYRVRASRAYAEAKELVAAYGKTVAADEGKEKVMA